MTSAHRSVHDGATATAPVVDVVIPAYNEAADLTESVRRLHRYLRDQFPLTARITIVDNASTDRTWEVASALTRELEDVWAIHLDRKGRGLALRHAWSRSDASIVAYMDVDLSTDLSALLPLVAPLVSGHSDLAIGSRLSRGSRVVRGPKREMISRSYNLLLRLVLGVGFSDAQCGFKAVRADRARRLLPLVENDAWFFDTELLVLAERAGLRIHEVPVDWVDDPDTRVEILATAVEDLRGIARLASGLATGRIRPRALVAASLQEEDRHRDAGLVGQVVRFALVGAASTLGYTGLYLGTRAILPAQMANLLALLLSALVNTAVNRRFTFGVTGRHHAVRQQAQGLVVFGIGLGLTAGSLAVLGAAAPNASRPLEVAVLAAANLVATLVRFLLFRGWVFGIRRKPATESAR
jgi:putative flippase GtrA